jgi:hypothetical protein
MYFQALYIPPPLKGGEMGRWTASLEDFLVLFLHWLVQQK